MFNFFKKKQENDIIASISYLMKRDGSGPYIDVEINDNDSESIDGLCSILDVLGKDMFYLDTISMIRTLLSQSNQQELLLKILTRVSENVRKKILDGGEKVQKDEPCIKPSDMLK